MIIAILITVHNKKTKTLLCLDSIEQTLDSCTSDLAVEVFLTDDGSTDGTSSAITERKYRIPITLLQGDGHLFWNRGMIN